MRFAAFALTFAVAVTGCDDDEPTAADAGPPDDVRRAAFEAYAAQATVLRGTLAQLADESPEPTLEALQADWRAMMAAWQALAPALTGAAVDTREAVYSWPTVSPCRVDQEIVAAAYGEPGFFDAKVVNVYGLDALEYLLFHAGAESACPPQVDIRMDGSWDALSAEERARRRLAYAVAARARLARDIARVPLPAGADFDSGRAALDDVFRALFHVDLVVKDVKLAIPAGINPDCAADACPDEVESRWARHSKENIAANLRGAEAPTAALTHALRAHGAPELATQLETLLAAAQAAVDAIDGPLADAVADEQRRSTVVAAHGAVKAFTDLLKSQVVSTLNLSVPDEGAADND